MSKTSRKKEMQKKKEPLNSQISKPFFPAAKIQTFLSGLSPTFVNLPQLSDNYAKST